MTPMFCSFYVEDGSRVPLLTTYLFSDHILHVFLAFLYTYSLSSPSLLFVDKTGHPSVPSEAPSLSPSLKTSCQFHRHTWPYLHHFRSSFLPDYVPGTPSSPCHSDPLLSTQSQRHHSLCPHPLSFSTSPRTQMSRNPSKER